jgi:hypothetical protein
MRSVDPRARLLSLVTAPLLLAVAGCGGSSGSQVQTLSPAAAVKAAVITTTEQHSFRIALDTRTDVGSVSIDLKGEGVFDYANSLGHLTMTVPASAGKLDEIVVKNKLYLQLPGQGTAYYALDRAAIAGTTLGAAADPTSGLQTLNALSDDVKSVDKVAVRGATTTHYRGTLDLTRAAALVTGLAKTALQSLIRSGAASQVPFDAYIDSAGRLRKLVQSITTTSPKLPGQKIHVLSTVELYDFGTPVVVHTPTSVKDGTPLLTALQKQFTNTG